MNRNQAALQDRLGQARKIIEKLEREYSKVPAEEQWKYHLKSRICATIQTELVVSERKAKEYMKLIRNTHKA